MIIKLVNGNIYEELAKSEDLTSVSLKIHFLKYVIKLNPALPIIKVDKVARRYKSSTPSLTLLPIQEL